MERDRQAEAASATPGAGAATEEEAAALGIVFAHGTIPGVGAAGDAAEPGGHQTASELAYGDGARTTAAHAQHATAHYHLAGEPLPVLKEILGGKHGNPKQNLALFLDVMRQATARPGAHGARTLVSPADGLAAIITGVILDIVERYRHVATPKQQGVLDHILRDHLTLLSTPMSRDGRGGGHRVSGVKGHGDGLAGPALSHGASVRVETVNQTAVVLLALERLVENPLFAAHHDRIQRMIDHLTPEFRASVEHCYRGRDVHDWHYGLSSRLEDQSHLKTSYEQMKKLAKTNARAKHWYQAQVERIARLWPRVTGKDDLPNTAGSLPHTG